MPQSGSNQPSQAELQLYELLKRNGDAAYSRYNALLREMISFENALDHRITKLGI